MLKSGIRFLFLLIVSCFLLSCNENKSKGGEYVNQNFKHFSNLYKILNDSIEYYKHEKLVSFLNIYKETWIIDTIEYLQIDSLLCVNSKGDKVITTMNYSMGKCKDCAMDMVTKILGKKINGKWYFFQGANLVVPRDMYGKDAMHPLSFHELSQIARTEFLSGALVKGKNGKYVVDDNWVDEHFYNLGWGRFKDTAKYDSVHWFYITDKWKHKIDTNEYKPLRKNKNSEAVL